MKRMLFAACAALAVAALATPASAQSQWTGQAGANSSVSGGQTQGSAAGPGSGSIAGSYGYQSSDVQNGANAYVNRNNAIVNTYGYGSASGVNVSGAYGNADAGVEGGSEYTGNQRARSRTRRR
ncbi:MAG TPA: hypothetical protein VEB18_02555 [Candidatus Paceibacterota bacterium]|nr:hypothetical protein [Candidatus Paceibacterota bacterium]